MLLGQCENFPFFSETVYELQSSAGKAVAAMAPDVNAVRISNSFLAETGKAPTDETLGNRVEARV